MMNGNQMNYVASGLQFAKFLYKDALESQEITDMTGRWLSLLNNANNHKFSVLFNAFTEKKMGPHVQKTLKPYVHDVHSDSGGLQIISRGLSMSAERKKQIYATQAKYSDTAMSFDEIPVYTLVQKSELKDASNKVFDRAMLIPCAKETAKNLTQQIEFFLDEKTTTKPLAIIQGNCLETAKIWSDTLFSDIPDHLHQYIGGIAIGSPALGVGELEEVKKAFWFTQIPFDIKDKHLHMLGIGAMKRILPTLVFSKNGLFKDTFISYDSTTHTSMNTYGRYYYGTKGKKDQVSFDRTFSHYYVDMYEDMITIIPEVKEFVKDPKDLHRLMNANTKEFLETNPSRIPLIMPIIAHAICCIYNFTHHVNEALHDDEVLYSLADTIHIDKSTKPTTRHIDKTKRSVYKELGNIKSLEDYRYWEAHLGRFLDSKPSRNGHTNLDAFF